MVFFYSGTGNSRYVAKRIAQGLSSDIVSLNDLFKSGDSFTCTDENIVFVTPTYAWRIPRIVSSWIEANNSIKGKNVWFVMTCGSDVSNASKYSAALADQCGFKYMGTFPVVMPENYIAMFSTPATVEARKTVDAAEPEIDRALSHILKSEEFPKLKSGIVEKIKSGIVNTGFYKKCIKDAPFTFTEKCIGCGRCVSVCPVNNIRIDDGKPSWGGRCIHCMGCISYCPEEAIEYGRISVGKPRYCIEKIR